MAKFNHRLLNFLPSRNPSTTIVLKTAGNVTTSNIGEILLHVYGHSLLVPKPVFGRRVACFSFDEICRRAYGAVDFIALAQIYNVILIENIPLMDIRHRNEVSYV
jgi:predicted ATPase